MLSATLLGCGSTQLEKSAQSPTVQVTDTPTIIIPTMTPTETPTPTPTVLPTPVLNTVFAASENLSGYKPYMNEVEIAHNLPLGILWAIAIRESSGGLHACGYNAWGIDSCNSYNYVSWSEGIDAAGRLLSYWVDRCGNLRDALCTWQSGQVCSVAGEWYANEVLAIAGIQ